MTDLITIGNNTVCASRSAELSLQRLGCRASGIGSCGYSDTSGRMITGHDWTCPSGVYNVLDNVVRMSNNGSISAVSLSSIADRIGVVPVVTQTETQVARQQSQQRQTVQEAVQAAVQTVIDEVWKPTEPQVSQQVYTKPTTVYADSSSQGTVQSQSSAQSQAQPTTTQASIIPSGWGWPIAIGGAVIVVGTIFGMWYRNRRGL